MEPRNSWQVVEMANDSEINAVPALESVATKLLWKKDTARC